MDTEPIAVALKFGFLAVLYLFLFWVARSAFRELRRTSMPSFGGFGGESGMGSESEPPGSLGSSERIKIGERPPEQTWPGGGNR